MQINSCIFNKVEQVNCGIIAGSRLGESEGRAGWATPVRGGRAGADTSRTPSATPASTASTAGSSLAATPAASGGWWRASTSSCQFQFSMHRSGSVQSVSTVGVSELTVTSGDASATSQTPRYLSCTSVFRLY